MAIKFSFNSLYLAPLILLLLTLCLIIKNYSLEYEIQEDDLNLDNHNDNCKSKMEFYKYLRHASPFRSSPELVARVREYEALHAKCADQSSNTSCRYVVFVPAGGLVGLGNKIVAIVSTFVYALLTNRVMYIARQENLDQLFCEPFPTSSWLLPQSMDHIASRDDSIRLGNLIGSAQCNTKVSFPDTVFSELANYRGPNDAKFFCQEQQDSLAEQVTWLVLSSDQYFLPALYHHPSFRSELMHLFPNQELIFHLLIRYLIHPVNLVWERTTRYYNAYLAEADTVVGVQMRVHTFVSGTHNVKDPNKYAEEVFQCLTEHTILPKIANGSISIVNNKRKKVAVILTSLNQRYFDDIKSMYMNYDTVDGSRVTVYQPSHEGEQQTGNMEHDVKALVEIYLLTLSDVLFTSPISTFGYSAQGLVGVRPWQVYCEDEKSDPNSSTCFKKSSMEPCYHTYPGEMMVDNVQNCECNLGFMLKAFA